MRLFATALMLIGVLHYVNAQPYAALAGYRCDGRDAPENPSASRAPRRDRRSAGAAPERSLRMHRATNLAPVKADDQNRVAELPVHQEAQQGLAVSGLFVGLTQATFGGTAVRFWIRCLPPTTSPLLLERSHRSPPMIGTPRGLVGCSWNDSCCRRFT